MKIAILGGLVDGINPCAFAVVLFFVAFLSRRKEYLVAGTGFILGVFSCYFFLGLLGYSFLEKIIVPKIANITTRIIAFSIILLGIFHLIESRHNPSSWKIALDKRTKKLIQRQIIKTGLQNASFLKFIALGILIALLESACTGQVYLPVIYSFVALKVEKALFLLFIYNLCFILPLLLVFGLGIAIKEGFAGWDIRYIRKFKVILGLFLILLGCFMLKRGCYECGKANVNNFSNVKSIGSISK